MSSILETLGRDSCAMVYNENETSLLSERETISINNSNGDSPFFEMKLVDSIEPVSYRFLLNINLCKDCCEIAVQYNKNNDKCGSAMIIKEIYEILCNDL